MRQGRQNLECSAGAPRASPQQAQMGAFSTGNSDQQAAQIGAEESCGRGVPHRAQEAGSSVQLKLSRGLRSTRTTARHRVVCDGGTSVIRIPEFLLKTHLAQG
jgi:hypothetical protein